MHISSNGVWSTYHNGIPLDIESLLRGYAIPAQRIPTYGATQPGLAQYRFAFGKDVKWFFRVGERHFWNQLRGVGRNESALHHEQRWGILEKMLKRDFTFTKFIEERKEQYRVWCADE